MTELQKLLVGLFASVAMAAGALVAIGTSGNAPSPDNQPTPAPTSVRPSEQPPTAQSKPGPHVDKGPIVQKQRDGKVRVKKAGKALTTFATASTTCPHTPTDPNSVNPGNPCGYPWYSGYRWPNVTLPSGEQGQWICIDSSIPGHPLASVATKFRKIDPKILISAYVGAGQCAAHGFPKNRYVSFVPFTTHDKNANPSTCGMTIVPNYGAYGVWTDPYFAQLPMIKINVTGYQRTPCGTAPEWEDVWLHELGHSFGLSHKQPRATSILRDGHAPDAYDIYYMRMIAGFYPTVPRTQIP